MQVPRRKSEKYTSIPVDPNMTEDKFNELKIKLQSMLKTRPSLAKDVQTYAANGDFSENAEYQIAKARLRRLNRAIDETKNLLEANNIGWSGFSHLAIVENKKVNFGFLAYNGIGTAFDREAIANEIKNAKTKVDILVVSTHWGDEYVLTPGKYGNVAPDDPREIGHLMINAGADLIIGNHPHTVQGVEIYQGKLITYAHGNFIFDQTWSQETQEGVVGEYTFYLSSETSAKEGISEPKGQTLEAKLVNVKFYPTLVDVSYQPRFLDQKDGQHILDRMLKSSNLISEK